MKNNNLESLRGFACLMVVLHHLIQYQDLWPRAFVFKEYINYAFPAHFAVLIFFMLSGYVIGINYENNFKDIKEILTYLKKRFIRLYPIYIICICFTFILNFTSIKDFGYHLVFLQGVFRDINSFNDPLWSIHFEIVFYILFIPISFFKITPQKVLILLVFLLISLKLINSNEIAMTYIVGFIFWMTGLWLSKFKLQQVSKINYLPYFALILCFVYNPLGNVLTTLFKFKSSGQELYKFIQVNDLILLPSTFFFIIKFSKISHKNLNFLELIVYTTVVLNIFLTLYLKKNLSENFISYIILFVFLLFSFVFRFSFFQKVNDRFLNFTNNIGSISYSVYILHAPIFLFLSYQIFINNDYLNFLSKLIVGSILTFSISYYLEKKLQPLIKNFLYN